MEYFKMVALRAYHTSKITIALQNQQAKKRGGIKPPHMSAPQTCPAGLFLLILFLITLFVSILSCLLYILG
jgi:hypothetical protein